MKRAPPELHRPLIGLIPGGLPMGFATFTITMMAFFRVSLLPEIGDDLAMSVSRLGLFTTLFGLGRLVADVPAGHFADRVRPRNLMATAALLVAAGSILLGAAQSSVAALAAAFLLGIGSALTNTSGQVFFTTRAPVERRGTSVSLYAGLMLAGMAFGPTLGGGVASISTWRVAEQVAGLALLGVSLFMVEPKGRGTVRSRDNPDPSPRSPVATIPLPVRIALMAVPFALFGAAGVTIQTLVPVIGDQDLGLSVGQIGLAIGVGGVVRVLATIVGGQLSDRVSRKAALVPAMIIGAAGAALLALGSGYVVWLTAIVLMAAAAHAVSASATIIADLSPIGRVGKNLGTFRFVGDIGFVFAPVVAARLFENVGPEAALLPLAFLLAAVGVMVMVIVPDTRWVGSDLS